MLREASFLAVGDNQETNVAISAYPWLRLIALVRVGKALQFLQGADSTVRSVRLIIYRSRHRQLFRYDEPRVSDLIRDGSIRITTLDRCRNAEQNDFRRDPDEGTKTTTSLPGRNSLNSVDLAKLFGVDPKAIKVNGHAGVITEGLNAVRRTSKLPDAFIFCTSSLANDPYMKGNFGDGCLKINNPVAFFEIVDDVLRKKVAPNLLGPCIVDDVQYVPRTNNYRDHSDKHMAFIKPGGGERSFERESEVRALWIPQLFDIQPVTLAIPAVQALLELV